MTTERWIASGCRWSRVHRRPRYRCLTEPGARGHAFSLPVPVRQPTAEHPDSGVACPRCEYVYERHDGVRTGIDFMFGHAEIARLFLRLGDGRSSGNQRRRLSPAPDDRRQLATRRPRCSPAARSLGGGTTSGDSSEFAWLIAPNQLPRRFSSSGLPSLVCQPG